MFEQKPSDAGRRDIRIHTMFDLSFPEIIVICIGALAVMKPEEIPGAARKLGRYLGRLRSFKAEWSGHLQSAAQKLEQEIDGNASSDKTPQPPAPAGGIVGYRPEGSDQIYERYVDDIAAEYERTENERYRHASQTHQIDGSTQEGNASQKITDATLNISDEQPLIAGKDEIDAPSTRKRTEKDETAQAERYFTPAPPCDP